MYSTAEENEVTIFDRILLKEIPCTAVYEDEFVFAFNDRAPQAPIHVLIIPKTKIESLRSVQQLSDTELAGFLRGISNCAQALGLNENGYRVVFNNGAEALQTVAYCHAHLLAGKLLSWPPC
jgi:histidine triad (HIT) family protein